MPNSMNMGINRLLIILFTFLVLCRVITCIAAPVELVRPPARAALTSLTINGKTIGFIYGADNGSVIGLFDQHNRLIEINVATQNLGLVAKLYSDKVTLKIAKKTVGRIVELKAEGPSSDGLFEIKSIELRPVMRFFQTSISTANAKFLGTQYSTCERANTDIGTAVKFSRSLTEKTVERLIEFEPSCKLRDRGRITYALTELLGVNRKVGDLGSYFSCVINDKTRGWNKNLVITYLKLISGSPTGIDSLKISCNEEASETRLASITEDRVLNISPKLFRSAGADQAVVVETLFHEFAHLPSQSEAEAQALVSRFGKNKCLVLEDPIVVSVESTLPTKHSGDAARAIAPIQAKPGSGLVTVTPGDESTLRFQNLIDPKNRSKLNAVIESVRRLDPLVSSALAATGVPTNAFIATSTGSQERGGIKYIVMKGTRKSDSNYKPIEFMIPNEPFSYLAGEVSSKCFKPDLLDAQGGVAGSTKQNSRAREKNDNFSATNDLMSEPRNQEALIRQDEGPKEGFVSSNNLPLLRNNTTDNKSGRPTALPFDEEEFFQGACKDTKTILQVLKVNEQNLTCLYFFAGQHIGKATSNCFRDLETICRAQNQ